MPLGEVGEVIMSTLHYTDDHIASIFQRTKTIAMVGASPKPHRASNRVMQFLQERNYRVIPVNSLNSDRRINGEKVYTSLDLVPDEFQMVEIFRNVHHAIEITKVSISLSKLKKIETIWMQLDIRSDHAAHIAEKAGLNIIMDRCPAIEIRRLIKIGHLSSGVDGGQQFSHKDEHIHLT
ncbi:MAG TPA: CoA-binding protein [Rhodospirillales bacterium]|jgi:predicted CoA-binding protein|nr:CoA-binding protein [Rhodospirillales bacterium]